MMKKYTAFFTILILILVGIQGCGDDDKEDAIVDSTPEFTMLVEEVASLPGENFVFEALIEDPAGIQSVNMKYAPWFLDKTIVKNDLPVTYNLAYRFEVPQDEDPASVHIIPITVTNAGGKTFTKEVTITLDKDISAPVISIQQPVDGSSVLIGEGNEIVFEITVTDNDALAEFKIESEILTESIPISGASFTYTKELDIANTGTYSFAITTTDLSGNIKETTIIVTVLQDLLFDTMYITDVTEDAMLVSDLFGVPFTTIASTEAEEDGYVFTAKYYASNPNTEVRFLPQATSFAPFSFGGDPNTIGALVLGTDASVDPIVLPEVGYYEIKMDLRNLSYAITPYTPTDTPFDQVYIIGRGIEVGDTDTCTANANGSLLCWNFGSSKPFVADSNNSYLWTLDATLQDQPDDEGENGFILNANPDGWSPFWRFDSAENPTATVPNGGENYVFQTSDFGDYVFNFDTHLNRISVQRK